MKYNVGDKVKIRSDLNERSEYDGCLVIDDMRAMAGKSSVITEKRYSNRYRIEGSGWNWAEEMFEGLVREDKRLKAFDLMKLAFENPQKYEGKKYKVVDGHAIGICGEIVREFVIVKDGILHGCSGHTHVSQVTEVEEIPQSVPFLEAVKAKENGEQYVTCKYNGIKKIYGGIEFSNVDYGEAVTFNEILYGEWYIGKA